MTGGLPVDVVQFVERRFADYHAAEILSILDNPVLATPRVMRAVLFLADGSMSLLKHYVAECEHHVNDVLMHAEYVVGVAREPMAVRDMSLPYSHEDNLGPSWMWAKSLDGIDHPRRAPRRSLRDETLNHHAHLANQRFVLGQATYLVALTQPSARFVRCYRREGNVSQVVKLPLVFVLERLAAEHIEIAANRPSDFISSVR